MNAKLCKKIRKATRLAAAQHPEYKEVEYITFRQFKTVLLHPTCWKSVYRMAKKEARKWHS